MLVTRHTRAHKYSCMHAYMYGHVHIYIYFLYVFTYTFYVCEKWSIPATSVNNCVTLISASDPPNVHF